MHLFHWHPSPAWQPAAAPADIFVYVPPQPVALPGWVQALPWFARPDAAAQDSSPTPAAGGAEAAPDAAVDSPAAAGVTAPAVMAPPAPTEPPPADSVAAEPAPVAADNAGTPTPPADQVAAPDSPAVPDAGPPAGPSQEELDLYAQFAGLYDDFNGDQALADLLASDWAAQNGWQGAGGAPLG